MATLSVPVANRGALSSKSISDLKLRYLLTERLVAVEEGILATSVYTNHPTKSLSLLTDWEDQ